MKLINTSCWRKADFPVGRASPASSRIVARAAGNEAEVFFAPKSGSSRRRLPFLNTFRAGRQHALENGRDGLVRARCDEPAVLRDESFPPLSLTSMCARSITDNAQWALALP